MDTLTQMFHVGIIGVGRPTYEKIPQGSVPSSLLCNIYPHRPDDGVDRIKKEWNTESKKRHINPEYRKLIYLDERTMARSGGNPEQLRREKRHRVRTARKLRISHQDYKNPGFVRVRYIRYADDFPIGVLGSEATALKIPKRVTQFIQSDLKLQVNAEKNRLSHAVSDKIPSLGVLPWVPNPKHMPVVSSAYIGAVF